ncbi:MAG: family inner membrane protein YdjZ [Planctomycetota bacterium]|jgi:uncharacterized membrane protein YdjX (TVP38/TMEM64 family)
MASAPTPPSAHSARGKITLLIVLLIAAIAGFVLFRDTLSLNQIAERETLLRDWIEQRPIESGLIAFVLYVAVAALAIPLATVLSLTYAWLFGFTTSLLLVSFASTLGACLSFLASRYLIADWVRARFPRFVTPLVEAIERDGALYLFTLRLVPYVPFFVINLVMGLTGMRLRTFWLVSQLGMLPGTIVYLLAGSSVASLAELARLGPQSLLTPRLIVALTLLGLFPFVVKQLARVVQKVRARNQPT